jgi:hypothetical protein
MLNEMTVRICNAEPPSLGEYYLGYTDSGLLFPRSKSAIESCINDLVEERSIEKGSVTDQTSYLPTFVTREPR